MALSDFVSLYLAPLFQEVIEDYDSQLNELDDQIGELAGEISPYDDDETEEALAAALDLIQDQSILILGLAKAGGLMDGDGFTEKTSGEIRGFFEQVNAKSKAFAERFGDLAPPEQIEEENDDPPESADGEDEG